MTHPSEVAADIAQPEAVAHALGISMAALAQLRYRGTGPRFIKRGRRILYRWSDVSAYLDAGTKTRTDGKGAALTR